MMAAGSAIRPCRHRLWQARLTDPSQASMQAALLRACAGGDPAALARLYEGTAAQLFGLALRIVRRRELAEEVVQDAFVSAWRNAGRYDGRSGWRRRSAR